MTRVLVWDLPTRLFHWMLAGGFLAAFGIATLSSDDGPLFPIHAALGLVVTFMVALRVVWGLIGSRWSRFDGFAWSPAALVGYLREVVSWKAGDRFAGHNPASSWTTAAMFAMVLGLGATGIAMGLGLHAVHEIHEILAWGLLVSVGVHLAGVIGHSLRYGELLPAAMIDGKKVAAAADAIPSIRPIAALAFLALTGLFAGGVAAGIDPQAGTLGVPGIGAVLQIGEGAEGEEGEGGDHDDDDDDDDDE